MEKNLKADYCIEIDFEKNSKNPSRVFHTMYGLIETFEFADRSLVQSIDSKIEPILILEDIEIGSIKTWLRNILTAIDDDALKNLDWRPAIGKYIVKSKYFIIDFLKDKTEITNRQEIKKLEDRLFNLAKDTDIKRFPAYKPIPSHDLLQIIERVTSNVSHLQEGDKAKYITHEGEANFNIGFNFSPESIEELFVKDIRGLTREIVLKIKKPDYLGESMWEFRYDKSPIVAKILDIEWLKKFQARKVNVQPGDSIRAIVYSNYKYGFDGELVATHHEIKEVKDVLQDHEQKELFEEKD